MAFTVTTYVCQSVNLFWIFSVKTTFPDPSEDPRGLSCCGWSPQNRSPYHLWQVFVAVDGPPNQVRLPQIVPQTIYGAIDGPTLPHMIPPRKTHTCDVDAFSVHPIGLSKA